ncbi:hypothetical protein Tco_1165481, partial [Tanacetum coccineum]
ENINTTQAQQKALDGALVAPANSLEFGKCNTRLKTDIKLKKATFQVVIDALALTSFYRAFLITADVPAIYMQEFWAIFCPKIPGQKFEDLPLEHDILSFIRDLGNTIDITYLTDGMFHKKNIDYVYLLWEDLLFQIENKDAKKTNKMSYPRFTKIIIDYFMSKDQFISRRNKMFWHTALDDTMFTSMRCISRHEDTQKKQPEKKTKAKGLAVLSEVALTEAEQLKMATKRSKKDFHMSHASILGDGVDTQSKVPDEQQQKSSGTDEGTSTIPGVPDVPIYESESEKESWGDSEDEDEDDENDYDDISDEGDEDNDGKNDNDDDDANEEENNNDEETMYDDEDDEVTKELYEVVNMNLGNEDTEMTNANPVHDTQKADEPVQSSYVSSNFTSRLLNLENPSPADNEIASLMETLARHATAVPEISSGFTTTIPPPPPFFNPLLQQVTPTPTPTTSEATTLFPPLSNFTYVFKFNERVFNLEKYMSEIKQVDQYAQALSSIPAIFYRYMDNKLGEAINKAILAHNLDCRQEARDEKNAYIELADMSMRALIKEEKNVTESVEAEVLTWSSSQPTSTYEAATSLSEFELTKMLIDKMEKNKSYDKADYKKKLYDALRSRDDSDKDRDPSAGSNRGKKRRKSSKDIESSRDSRLKEKKSSSTFKDASQFQHKSFGKSAHVEEPSHTIEDSGMQQDQEFVTGDNDEQPADKEVTKADWFKKPERPPTPYPDWSKRRQVDFRHPQTWISQVAHAEEPPTSFDELNDTSFDFSAFFINRLKIPNLTQEILVKYDQHAYLGTSYWGPKHQRFYGYASNLTSSKDVYSRRRIIVVTRLKIMKMYDYGHLEEIEVRQDDQKLYTFKEGDFKRLRLQDIEDMLLLLVQQKLTNLTIDERYDLNVALHMYTRRIVIQRRMGDLQLCVESYQQKLNLTKSDSVKSNLRQRTTYTAYSNPKGVIYKDQINRNRLMRADELHKFSDGTLDDVRSALNDIAKGIRMKYLPMRKWSNLDKKRARVMVQDIDKQLYQMRLMQNLDKFVGGKEYGKDLRLLERTI